MRLHTIEPLNEGGNIFKNASGESVTGRINRADIAPTIKWLETITKLPLVDNTLGSVGKKESSGDLDIAVDQNAVSKDELVARLTQWVKAQKEDPKNWIKKSGISVHFLTPIRGNKTLGYVQSDFMFGDDIEHMKFGLYSAGDSSKFSGADRNLLMSSVAKSLPGDYKYSWQKGLIERSTGNTITRDPDQIAKILLGSMKYTRKDLDSVESIISAIKNPPDKIAGPNRYELLTALADRLTSTEGKKPAEIRADSEEATRLHKILGGSMRLFETAYSKLDTADEQVQIAAVRRDSHAIYYIKNPSKEVQLAAVQQNGSAIDYIKNPSKEVQIAAVQQNGYAIQIIKNPSEEVKIAAVSKYGHTIRYIKNPSEEVQIAAVKQDGSAIQLINNPSINILNKCKHEIIKLILDSIKDNAYDLAYMLTQKAAKTNWPELAIIKKSLDHEKNRLNEEYKTNYTNLIPSISKELRYGMISQAIHTINSYELTVDNCPGLKELLNKYKHDIVSYLLNNLKDNINNVSIVRTQFINNTLLSTKIDWPELAIINKSLEHEKSRLSEGLFDKVRDWYAGPLTGIDGIDMSSPEKIKLAIEKNGFNIKFIKNPSEELQMLAINNQPLSITQIKNPSEKVQIQAVKLQPKTIMAIKSPCEAAQIYAVSQKSKLISYIANPSEKVQYLPLIKIRLR